MPSHETSQFDDSQDDLEAETAPDLVEGDIAVSEVSRNNAIREVVKLGKDGLST